MGDLTITTRKLSFRNPILLASGTVGFGRELSDFISFSRLGGICSKGLTVEPRMGNPGCRVAETSSGMLNSVGLQNPGLELFLHDEYLFMESLDTTRIVNIAGNCLEDYQKMVSALSDSKLKIDVLELNLSCPNVKTGCMAIGATPEGVATIMRGVRNLTDKEIWVKLSPNVTSIVPPAQAAEQEGADAVVVINTLLGMAVDWRTRRPILFNNTGGLSGPAIKPIALRMVHDCYKNLSIPVIGVGGIMSAEDVLEFIICGARLVQIGTGTLIHPALCEKIVDDLQTICKDNKIERLSDLVGTLQLWGNEV